MRAFFLLVTLQLAAATLASAQEDMSSIKCDRPLREADWTVVYFSNGDNDLATHLTHDLNEVGVVGSTPIADIARTGKGINALMLIDPDDWSLDGQSYLFRFPDHSVSELSEHLVENKAIPIKEPNMVDGPTLQALVDYTLKCYPARHVALVINGHGAGARADSQDSISRTFGSDGSAGDDRLYVEEAVTAIKTALDANTTSTEPRKLDIIALDACLMSTVEVGYAFERVARILVASEALEGRHGWNHERWLRALHADLQLEPEEVATTIVDNYEASITTAYGADEQKRWKDQLTLAAIRLDSTESCQGGIHQLAYALGEAGSLVAGLEAGERARRLVGNPMNCPTFGPDGSPAFTDAACTVEAIRSAGRWEQGDLSAGDLLDRLLRVEKTLGCVMFKKAIGPYRHRSGGKKPSGMSVFLPPDSTLYRRSALGASAEKKAGDHPVRFFDETGWGKLLQATFARTDP